MGHSSDAHCFACGYDTALMLGAGMSNHDKFAAWPVSCRSCAEVTTANFRKPRLTCLECRSRDVASFAGPDLWNGDGQVSETWGDLTLTNGHYRCPKCNSFNLRFGTNAGGHSRILFD